MRNKTHLWKRSLAAFLSFVLLLGMVPALDIVPEAEAYTHTDANTDTQGSDYISLPITIRDFAADGMLFDYNDFGSSGTVTISSAGDSTSITVLVNPTSMGNSITVGSVTGYDYAVCAFIITEGNTPPFATMNWKTIYVNADGTINRVYEADYMNDDPDETIPAGGFMIGYHSANTYDTTFFGAITEAAKDSYTFSFAYDSSYTVDGFTVANLYRSTVVENDLAGTYNYGNNSGYGLLYTDAATYGDISLDEGNTTSATAYYDGITGTALLMNGSWSDTSDPDKLGMTLNSNATQDLYGGWIRTNLVEADLPDDKNMLYTQYTIKFLAEYLQATLAEEWEASDGSYNLWYVMGDNLFDDNNQYVGKDDPTATRDLAAVLRSQITSLGTYTEAKTDFGTEKLNAIQDIDTYFDAAYFLLHSTFDTVEGYGKYVPEYSEIRLVEKTKTNDDGTTSTYYIFNSAFDDTDYNYENGYITNTQTTTITDRGDEDTKVYTRGNIQALNRFDPLGLSGAGTELGYGISGSRYQDIYAALGDDDTATENVTGGYYETTNYNLSLEGHAQFIYYEDDNLYFTFTGDDDVYLFINGTRVLDLGGAHAISKATINLNEVATLCGLVDGHAYDFDFYYMERHGTAANFGIETNIKIAEPAMTTNKIGYQNQANTGYNGWVDPSQPVGYSFELTNASDSPIYNLTFNDPAIGVSFGYEEGSVVLNKYSDINAMYMFLYNADGTVKERYLAGSVTETLIVEKLKAGLPAGEKIGIYGFKYDITKEGKWASDGTFTNTVYTTSTPTETITENTPVLHGMAEWKVQKANMAFTPFHVYDWVAKDVSQNPETVCDWYSPEGATVTVTQRELLDYFVKAGKLTKDQADAMSGLKTVLCSASGTETGTNLNPNAKVNSDGSITYTSTKPGLDTVFFKIKGTGLENNVYDNYVFNYDVFTYGAVNNVYVLDYGLSVELNGSEFGLLVNDTLTLAQNKYAPEFAVTGIQDATSNYGDFVWNNPSLKYTPDAIINNIDSVRVNVQLREPGDHTDKDLKFYGVDMYETVTTAPATVVYYEENFPGITYVEQGENDWVHYETVDDEGNSVAGTEQSANQDSNYGSDPNYGAEPDAESDPNYTGGDKVGTIVSNDSVGTVVNQTTFNLDTSDLDAAQTSGVDALNQLLGLGSSDSNGTVNQLVVKETAEVMFFEFAGTGFEIISRTTMNDYAVINVQVQKKNADNTYTIVRQVPVITESIGGDLYQVPIISVTGLDKATYRVVVKAGVTNNDEITRILYIDGIRIYGPLAEDDMALEYYNPEEYQAEFHEVKQLVQDGHAIYTAVSDNGSVIMQNGDTLVEDQEGNAVLVTTSSVENYMQVGPNNELYLDGTSAPSVLAFVLTPVEDYPENARTIEVGAHRKADVSTESTGAVYLIYGSTADELLYSDYTYDVASGTEMYYSIDVENLTYYDAIGGYLLMIGVYGGEDIFSATLALTNLKVAGYTISRTDDDLEGTPEGEDPYEANYLNNLPMVQQPFAVLRARLAALEEETENEVLVNENLNINSAGLRATKIVSGRNAILTVKAGSEAETIVVTDADGNVVEAVQMLRKVSGNVATFTFAWKVTGTRGAVQEFTIRVYDANGLASVNTESVSVTIR